MNRTWQTKSSRSVLKNDWFRLQHDKYVLPNRQIGDYFFVATRGASVIVPVINQDKIVMIKQYRYLTKQLSIEFPMGGIKKNQTPLKSAKAELAEEAGYIAKKFIKLGSFNPYIGLTDEACHVYMARGLKKCMANPDTTEKITVVTFTPSEIDEMIRKNKIISGQSIAAWHLAQHYLN